MFIPRFANPHALNAATEIVSRSILHGNDSDLAGEEVIHDGELLTELDRLVKRSLGDLGNSDDANEKSRKKRRKTGKEESNTADMDFSESTPIRLVSRRLPPKTIALKAKPPPIMIVKEPPCEDNEQEATLRKLRAENVAVNIDWIHNESKRVYPPRRLLDHKMIHVAAELPTSAPSVVVIARNLPTRKLPHLAKSVPTSDVHPSPYALPPSVKVPLLDVSLASSQETEAKPKSSRNVRRARAKARTAQPRPPAVFWRPLREWGVRAAGYSVGCEGSWPVSQHDPSRYKHARDTMRRGIMAA